MRKHFFLAFLLAAMLMVGCQTVPVIDASSSDEARRQLEEGIARNAEISAQAERLREELARELEEAERAQDPDADAERFDLSVDQLDAQVFFRSLVRGTRDNIVVHPDIAGKISLELTDVTVAEVMAIMRDVYGYDFVREGRLYSVYPDAIRSEIFHVDYLNVARRGRSEMQVSAGTVSESNQRNSGVQQGGQVATGRTGDSQWRDSASVIGTSINTDSDANFWSELQDSLTRIVGGAPGTQVVVTPQAGMVLVRAMPDALRAVRSYLEQAQLTLQRQVILEAKIIEVTLDEAFQAGIDWHIFGNDRFDARFESGNTSGIFNPLGSSFSLAGSFHDFDAVLSLLQTQGTVQVLSSPRIATVNNQKAVIKVGRDEFFVTDLATTAVTSGAAISISESPQLTPFFSGIALDVTPQISSQGNVTLHVHPTVSQVTEQRKTIGGEDVPLAASTIRESDSIVRAKSGQIVVIGGLMQDRASDEDAALPGLSRIPLLGYAFRQKQQHSTKSELVILLRPIVVDDDAQTEMVRRSLEQIEAISSRLKR